MPCHDWIHSQIANFLFYQEIYLDVTVHFIPTHHTKHAVLTKTQIQNGNEKNGNIVMKYPNIINHSMLILCQ